MPMVHPHQPKEQTIYAFMEQQTLSLDLTISHLPPRDVVKAIVFTFNGRDHFLQARSMMWVTKIPTHGCDRQCRNSEDKQVHLNMHLSLRPRCLRLHSMPASPIAATRLASFPKSIHGTFAANINDYVGAGWLSINAGGGTT